LGGFVLSAVGLLLIAFFYVGSGIGDPSVAQSHAATIIGIPPLAAGVLCFGLALWLYRAKRVGRAVTGEPIRHCESCGHDWDEYSHADLRSGMPDLSVPSEDLVRADRDKTAG
jgi:hypothetical protein